MSSPIPEALGRLVAAPPLRELARTVAREKTASANGLWGSSVAAVIAALRDELKRPVMLVCGHLDEADDLADDIELFAGQRPAVLPALELGGTFGRASEELVSMRLQLIARMAGEGSGLSAQGSVEEKKTGTEKETGTGTVFSSLSPEPRALNPMLIAPVQALMQAAPSREELANLIWMLKPGQELEAEKLIVWLSEHGYNRLDAVEVPGDFAVRGGIIDVYLPGEFAESQDEVGLTVRIDFFGDQIESIKRFSLESLGSGAAMQQVQILDLKGNIDTTASTSLYSYLHPHTIVVLWAPLEIAEQSKSYLDRLQEVKGIYPLPALLRLSSQFARLELSQFDQGTSTSFIAGENVPHVKLPIRSLQRFETDAKHAITELKELAETHDVTVFCDNEGERQRFCELLETNFPGLCGKIATPVGYLHRGFVYGEEEGSGFRAQGSVEEITGTGTVVFSSLGPEPRALSPSRPIALVGHHEIFHRYEQRRRVKKVIASRPVDSFLDLKVGDYVVHVAHGIAKFTGIQTIQKDGRSDEYLTLRFAESATLHVPATRINLIQKYIGGFHGHPHLSRLGSGVWEKQKAKVSEAVMDMAAELIEVQAARAAELGTPYPPDTEWQKEFEAEFPYEPTDDQVTSAEEIKADMQKPRPMDRLLCGDVGYGKTELAMRAAFKAIEYGKQVAILVPTTVLAEQHYRSFKERMANYPFEIGSVSRFKTAKEQKEIIQRTAAGEVDILIGTHRLISKDVKFADLGLVVIDEEQRFGVTHKERLKQMRKTVDVLTMSATPIPRTLHMSMLGLRDISSLTTAPQDRRSVVTEVMSYDKNRIKQAILRELNREGQVYFVHNRVYNILEVAEEIQGLVPDARILIGHGQMGEGELEDVMMKFIAHEADILVCTTIIESGLDIPNANTIFINKADRFGLSELHQLRGRVGRYKHRAYCYLLLPADRPVTPVAAKRLKAIEEYSHLGAGFKIAMRDLEIRGAGNILGPEQSGHIAAVGYEMYCQLLEEATRQLKSEPKPTQPEAHVDIGLTAYLPKTDIPGDRPRMDMYRRLTRCNSLEMLHALEEDAKDAYGEPPRQGILLFALTEVRLLAAIFGIESIIKQEPDVILKVRDAAAAQQGLTGAPGTLRVVDEKTVYLRMPATYNEPETLLMVLRNLMRGAFEKKKNKDEGGESKDEGGRMKDEGGRSEGKTSAMNAESRGTKQGGAVPGAAAKPASPVSESRIQNSEFAAASRGAQIATKKAVTAKLTPTPAPAPRIPENTIALIKKLDELRQAGLLSDAEFEAKRNELLARAAK
jgi:transcription-repair coupling factor (superfamily II helicase)